MDFGAARRWGRGLLVGGASIAVLGVVIAVRLASEDMPTCAGKDDYLCQAAVASGQGAIAAGVVLVVGTSLFAGSILCGIGAWLLWRTRLGVAV